MTDKYTFKLDRSIYTLFFNDIKEIYRVCKHDLSDMILDDMRILVNNAYRRGFEDGKNDR
jgi:hypothetical protein